MRAQPSYNFTLYQGATFDRTFTWKRGETRETATPVDLTGYIARMQIRETHDAEVAIVSLSSEGDDPHIFVGGSAGTFRVVISDEETADLDFEGPAHYDIELESAGGEVYRRLWGRVGLSKQVTR